MIVVRGIVYIEMYWVCANFGKGLRQRGAYDVTLFLDPCMNGFYYQIQKFFLKIRRTDHKSVIQILYS